MLKNKLPLLTLFLLGALSANAQKYITKNGNVKFEASVPSFEEVAAESKSTSAVFETSTGDFAALTLVKGFRFKVALMEEHFNENYVESDKYPKASFKGKVDDFDASQVTTAEKTVTITGDLTLHGKTKRVSSTAKISKSGAAYKISGSFSVKPEDFGIEIPKIVSKKVADKVSVDYNFLLNKQ
ncbi:YceI family protein [Flavobacterium microcysteis]|uniref:YceI family protein n=2 Tax=Flavobacterium microcysteis TaxID=2596891 RepID=A0A501QJY6_9FLAO|nr:YceI family protein [Flavobacterium microcysteis]